MADPTQDIVAPTIEEEGAGAGPGIPYNPEGDASGQPWTPVANAPLRSSALRPPMPPPGSFRIGRTNPLTGEEQVTTGFVAPRVPTDPRAELFRRQAASNDQLWRTLQERTAKLPIAQTEQAVAAALRFQGQRQYQRMLDAGIPAHEALARSAPLMFAGPRQSSLGQAAQFMKAATPAQKYHNVGGVLYQEQPDGSVKAVTGPAAPKFHTAGGVIYREGEGGKMEPVTPPAAPKISPFDTEEYRSVLSEIAKNDQAIADIRDPSSPRAEPLHARARLLRNRLAEIRRGAQAPTKGKRIRVRAPSGKFGTIPESQLEAAKAAGYTEVR